VRGAEEPFRSPLMDFLDGNSELLDRLVTEMCARGLSTRDVEDAFRDATAEVLTKSAVSGITDRLWEDYQAFISRDLTDIEVEYRFDDAVYESLRRPGAKEARLQHPRDQLEDLRDQMKDRLDTLRRQAEEGDLPSFETTLRERVGLVLSVAGGKGISAPLVEGEPIVWKVAEESLEHLPRNLFGGLSLSWSDQSAVADMMDVDAFFDQLDLDAIAKNPDWVFERVSFEHGQLAGQIEDLNRAIEPVQNPTADPFAAADPSTLTLEQAVAELDRVSRVRDELESKIRTWHGLAPPGSKTGPSLKELHDLQDKLNTTLPKYSRWMNNLPADDAELEEFVESVN
jgi:hypothetical protein